MTPISQKDPKWKDEPYTVTGDKSQTVGSSGCGLAAPANVYRLLTGKTLDLRDLAKLSLANGCRTTSDGTDWRFTRIFADTYGLEFERTGDVNKAIKELKAGAGVVVSTHGRNRRIFTTAGHYLAIMGYTDDGYFYVADSDFYSGKYTVGQRPVEIQKKRLVVNTQTLEMWVKPDLLKEEMSSLGFDILRLPKTDNAEKEGNDVLRYNNINEIPAWGKESIQKRIDRGIFSDPDSLDLSHDMLRILIFEDRNLKALGVDKI